MRRIIPQDCGDKLPLQNGLEAARLGSRDRIKWLLEMQPWIWDSMKKNTAFSLVELRSSTWDSYWLCMLEVSTVIDDGYFKKSKNWQDHQPLMGGGFLTLTQL